MGWGTRQSYRKAPVRPVVTFAFGQNVRTIRLSPIHSDGARYPSSRQETERPRDDVPGPFCCPARRPALLDQPSITLRSEALAQGELHLVVRLEPVVVEDLHVRIEGEGALASDERPGREPCGARGLTEEADLAVLGGVLAPVLVQEVAE